MSEIQFISIQLTISIGIAAHIWFMRQIHKAMLGKDSQIEEQTEESFMKRHFNQRLDSGEALPQTTGEKV